jgi:uncharacterized damage-inducible protein DinB
MNCKEGTIHIATQITTLLDQIDRYSYAKPLEIFSGSTLGQHFRHIVEFYHCLLQGIDNGLIDYANRQRNLNIEKDPVYAKQAFQEVLHAVEQLEENTELSVKADFSAENSKVRPVVQSSVGRELMFAYDHAVHHLAIIKIGLQADAPQIEVEPNLGIAPSTVKYRAGR